MSKKLRIAILEVGKGDSIVIVLPDKKSAIVVDTPNGQITYDYLAENNIKYIPYIFITHCDEDHYGGIIDLIQNLRNTGAKVENICYIQSKLTDEAKNPRYKTLMRQFLEIEEDIALVLPYASSKIIKKKDLAIEIIYPFDYKDITFATLSGKSNNYSIVLLIRYFNYRIILGGDLESEGWYRIVNRANNNKKKLIANILKYPHHGDWFPSGVNKVSTIQLLETIRPQYVAISVSTNNSDNHPNLETLKALKNCKYVQRFMCTQLTSKCSGSSSKVEYKLPKEIYPLSSRYNKNQFACSGTIIFNIDNNGISVFPEEDIHRYVIEQLCDSQCK